MCENSVTFYVPRGYSHRAVDVRCGRTDPWGGLAICDQCAADPAASADHERRLRISDEINAEARASGLGEF